MYRKLLFITLIVCLFISACGAADIAATPVEDPIPDESIHHPDELDQILFTQLSELYTTFTDHSADLWTSNYRFDQDQALYVRTDKDSNPLYAYILNYQDASILPGATLVETGYENLGNVYYLSEIPNAKRAESIPFFDFQYPVGDEEIFMMKYSEFDDYMSVDSFMWQLFVAHEAMHRYQVLHWKDRAGYASGEYNLEAENIALIYLENKLLLQALETEEMAVREAALRQFIAVRSSRNELWPETISVDNQQEKGEGMPRYLEYRLAVVTGQSDAKSKSISSELEVVLTPMEGMIRESLSFGRFYATGAALGYLLDELGLDWKGRIEAGETPFDILSDYYDIENAEGLIEKAKVVQGYDDLLTTAAKAAETAESEPEGEMGAGGTVEIKLIKKPYLEADPKYVPAYLPEGYAVLGMFSYSVDEIEFPPIREIYSPEDADVLVIDLGNGGGTEIRISRSAYHGTVEEYISSQAVGMPPLEDIEVKEYFAKGFSFQGEFFQIMLATGEELIIVEGPIGLDEAVKIMNSLLP